MTTSTAIVPLDGSVTAECVLPLATAMATALGLNLVLLRLEREAWPGGSEASAQALRPARHYLDGVAAALPTGDKLQVMTRALPVGDDIAAGITAAAGEAEAELIMIATRGHSGPKRWVLGSVADEVVRTADRPVLLVRADTGASITPPPAVQRVLAPLDGSPAAEAALAEAARLAGALGATLDIVQIVPWSATVYASASEAYFPEGLDEQLEQAAHDYLDQAVTRLPAGLTVERHVLRGSPAERILDHAEETAAGLIVMSTHGRSGIARFALGSVADRVVRGGSVPVLLTRQ